MKKALIALCLVVPATAMAKDFSYNYAEASYAYIESDGGDDGDGANVTLGWSPGEHVYTKLGGNWAMVDGGPVDAYLVGLTVGGFAKIHECADIYAGVIGAYAEYKDFPPETDDVDGYGIGGEIGVRGWLGDYVEVDVSGTYLDLRSGDLDEFRVDTRADEFTGAVKFRFYPVERFSLGLGYAYALDDETDIFTASARFDF